MGKESVSAQDIGPQPKLPVVGSAMPTQADFALLSELAKVVADSHMPLPADSVTWQAIFAKFMLGREFGLGPMLSLHEINIIEGRASLPAVVKVAIVRHRGLGQIEIVESTDVIGSVEVKRPEWSPSRVERVVWTMDDAQRAQLVHKKNWQKYPRAMLIARATDEACKKFFQDIFLGIAGSPDELGAETNEDGRIINVSYVPVESKAPWDKDQSEKPTTEPVVQDDLDGAVGERVATTAEVSGLAKTAEAEATTKTVFELINELDKAHSLSVEALAVTKETAQAIESADKADRPAYDAAEIRKTNITEITDLVKRVLKIDEPKWREFVQRFGGRALKELNDEKVTMVKLQLDDLRVLRILRQWAQIPADQWQNALKRRGVKSDLDLTHFDVQAMVKKLWETATPFDLQNLGLVPKQEGDLSQKKSSQVAGS